jgi:hypothetical protein
MVHLIEHAPAGTDAVLRGDLARIDARLRALGIQLSATVQTPEESDDD